MQFFQNYLSEYDRGLANLSEEDQLKIKEDMLVEVNRWAHFLCYDLFCNLLRLDWQMLSCTIDCIY